MSSIIPVVTDKKLRSTGISPGMRHRENSAVVVLIFSAKLTVDLIARAAGTIPFGATSLYHKIGNHPVECKSVIKTFLREVDIILYCIMIVFTVELYLTALSIYFNYHHSTIFLIFYLF